MFEHSLLKAIDDAWQLVHMAQRLDEDESAAAVCPALMTPEGEPANQIRRLPMPDTLSQAWRDPESLSAVAARSSTDVTNEDYEKILLDISSHVAENESGSDKVALPEGYLESLREVLNARGRTDLL